MTDPNRPTSVEYTKMLFLVGHGLQTPLSAIRWGCGRLSKSGENFTDEQKSLVTGIQQQTRTLAHMFETLLLLAKVDEHVHVPDMQQIYLSDFFQSGERTKNLPRSMELAVRCPSDATAQIDRTIFTAVIDSLLLVVAVSSAETKIPFTLEREDDTYVLIIDAPMEWSLLEEGVQKVVGGIPGFLLAVASALAADLGGSIESEKDGAVPTTLVFRFPATPTLPPIL